MIDAIEPMTWLAASYAGVLLAVAYGIDAMARRAARKVEEHRAGGFSYHADHDAWMCPEDQWLWPRSFDPDNRVMRYRGSPTICNACPVKSTCTVSDDGREMSRSVDSWPASEAARFHRGIACSVTVVAVLWPLATAVTRPAPAEAVLLLVWAAVVGLGALPLWVHLRRTPADPEGVLVRTLDENVEERADVALTFQRRRSSYASNRQSHSEQAPHVPC